MKALLCKTFGPPESLVLEDVPDPVAGKGQVVVTVKACGINFPDTLMIVDKYQFKPPMPFAPGGEVSGVVRSVGAGVTDLKVGDRVMAYMEKHYLPGLESRLVTERLFTPLDFETTLNTYRGSGFSFEPIFTQSAWFRPHNESEDVKGLFFCGAGTHPGAGVPGVLSSAKIVEKLVCDRLPV